MAEQADWDRSRIEDLAVDALALGAERQAAFLESACGGDTSLLAGVEEFLSELEQANTFFGEETCSLFGEKVGDEVGHYVLVEKLGEGGFGSVWKAEQQRPISRVVALKIIKAGMDTREFLFRFESERQALAMMEHPNIANVLDAGATNTGRPWFAMELVRGLPITRYCDDAKLPVAERLGLFASVCSALGHAHTKGVIHRDIKPSNVLVTVQEGRPVVKIIDFGIAKSVEGRLTDHTLVTRVEHFLGTPAYMSPEQAGGLDVDTRSDIYALGVLLYELLVGQPPFDGRALQEAGYDEMRRIIREVEPTRPSTRFLSMDGDERERVATARRIPPDRVRVMIPPDLNLIVLKAVEKDRSRRYPTADEFARDIARFLANEPVSAAPPSARYLFGKLARRHRVALRIAAGVAALLIAATSVSTWLAIRATEAEQLASVRLFGEG